MVFKTWEQEQNNNLTGTISEGAIIEGSIHTAGILRINGEVTGDIKSDNEVVIERNGKVEAYIKTKNATIAGHFRGEIISSGHVLITSTGRFEGNLIQKNALFSIAKGGLFQGKSIVGESREQVEQENNKITSFKTKKGFKKEIKPQLRKSRIS